MEPWRGRHGGMDRRAIVNPTRSRPRESKRTSRGFGRSGRRHARRSEESPGELKFARSIPLAKARADVLLAYKMNGRELPPEHGFPLRAIVPGWYAMASVKWLQRIIVTDQPFTGYYQTIDYAYWKRREDVAELTPLTEMQVKAQIAEPAEDEIVPANSKVRIHGAAWTCDGEITKVKLSTDGGATWNEASLIDKSIANAWRRWEYQWRTPSQPGKQILIARATDSRGRTQPIERD